MLEKVNVLEFNYYLPASTSVNLPTVARIAPSLPPFAPVQAPTQSLASVTCPSIILPQQRAYIFHGTSHSWQPMSFLATESLQRIHLYRSFVAIALAFADDATVSAIFRTSALLPRESSWIPAMRSNCFRLKREFSSHRSESRNTCPVPSGFEKQSSFSIFRWMVSFCVFLALWHAEVEDAESLQGHKNPSHHTQSTMTAVSGAL